MISERLSVTLGDAGLTGISSFVRTTSLSHFAVKEALAAPVPVPSKSIMKVWSEFGFKAALKLFAPFIRRGPPVSASSLTVMFFALLLNTWHGTVMLSPGARNLGSEGSTTTSLLISTSADAAPDSEGVTATAISLALPANSGTVNEKTHSPLEFERTLFTSDSILNLLAWIGLRFEFFRAISDGPPPPGVRRGEESASGFMIES